jgi:quercetin dioxygenase-like cupin family protein
VTVAANAFTNVSGTHVFIPSPAQEDVMKKYIASMAAAAAVLAAVATVARATPGSNTVGTVVARAGFADTVDIKLKLRDDQEVIHVDGAADTVMQQILIGPGGQTGWHSHPGPAIALITDGELTLYSGDDPTCTGRTFGAGQAFVDSGQGHVHMARNLTGQNTEVWVTYLDVPPGKTPRVDGADPGNCVF